MIDIGVNLTGSSFRPDLAAVIQRALDHGVNPMIVTGTDLTHSRQALELNREWPGVLYSTAGCHPHHASDLGDASLAAIAELLEQASVVAVGECGLDFNRNYSPREDQLRAFEAQLELAADKQMPVFLHQRDAHDEFVAILQRWRHRLVNAVVHCFTNGEEELRHYLDLDCYVGVTGWVCDEKRGTALRRAVPLIPDDRLMIETDAPYLLPKDLSPKPPRNRNEPAFLPHVAAAVARLRDTSVDTIAQQTTDNSRCFFQLGH